MKIENDNENWERISLYKVDLYLQGELNQTEKVGLEQKICDKPSVLDYIQRIQSQKYESQEKLEKPSVIDAIRHRLVSFFEKGRFRIGFSVSCVMVLLLTVITLLFRLNPDTGEFSIKGNSAPVITLLFNEKEYHSGDVVRVHSEDTLIFNYRSLSDLNLFLLYQEDKGEIRSFNKNDKALVWPGSSEPEIAAQRVVLDGNWERQTVWIVAAYKKMKKKEAVKYINKNRKDDSVEIFSFYFENNQE